MKSHYFFFATSALVLSTSAMAAGSHAGGHGEAAIGKPGMASKVTRTVQVDMKDDMRFHVDTFKAKRGETIRFVIKNSGALKHEMVLGTEKDLKDHYEVMKKTLKWNTPNPIWSHSPPGKPARSFGNSPKRARLTLPACNPATTTPA